MTLYTGTDRSRYLRWRCFLCDDRAGERRSKMKKATAAGVMAAAALVFAVPAQAAPEGNFLISETLENGMPPQQFMWSVTGCGDGCVTVHSLPNGWTQNFTFDGAN